MEFIGVIAVVVFLLVRVFGAAAKSGKSMTPPRPQAPSDQRRPQRPRVSAGPGMSGHRVPPIVSTTGPMRPTASPPSAPAQPMYDMFGDPVREDAEGECTEPWHDPPGSKGPAQSSLAPFIERRPGEEMIWDGEESLDDIFTEHTQRSAIDDLFSEDNETYGNRQQSDVASDIGEMDVSALRNAVIMAEILGKRGGRGRWIPKT